ncbi:WD40 repeat-like protein [Mycena venus]|uniref:WD40 repeat-like protein n=1 Tax=Mycena venus TaxID=2733690 RepID=A0A8H6XS58_9AGAR|nr:WD40 repeat-like protein [Mycena venus]
MSQTYALLVQSASISKIPGPHLGINLYVKIVIDQGGTRREYKTPRVKDALAPKWDFEQTISPSSASACIVFSLCHKTVVEKTIGKVTTTISELVQHCTAHNDAPVELDIQAGGSVTGKLCVLLKGNTADQSREAANHELLEIQQDIAKLSLTPAVSCIAGVAAGAVSVAEENKDLGAALFKVVSRLEPLIEMGDKIAKIHPYANLAWSVLTSVYKALEAKLEADQKIVGLAETMAEVYSFTDDVDFLKDKIKTLENVILKITIQTIECSFFIREYTGHGFLGSLVQTTLTDVSEKIEQFSQCLKQLKQQFDHATEVQILFFSAKIGKGVETLVKSNLLQQLKYHTFYATERKTCLTGTRVNILAKLTEHLSTVHPETNVYWLSGVAGSGKSTIANTVAQHFQSLQRLGVYIHFNSQVQ